MTDLTEQWGKGKLIDGKKYYCVSKNIADIFKAECHDKGQDDEWWSLKNEKYCFNNVYHKDDIEVLEQVPSYEEITKLKELLKEWLEFEREENPKDFTVISERMSELANKTNQALGEDK